ncbi:sensor domain-containing diguanylate cyclase [bacterium]|nr:sensor domain-containing diguanylate cyclase [bacterium]
MKNITLEKLIYKNYLKTSLASILFIELVLVIIYFTVNNNIIEKSIDLILKDIKSNTYELVNEKSKLMDDKIDGLETIAKILQQEHQDFFENNSKYNLIKNPTFDYAKNGMYYKLHDNGGSSLVVSNQTNITEELKKELIESEIFDLTFKTLLTHDKDIVAIYYNSHLDYSRYYPFLKNVYDVFPADIKMKNYNFYYLADEKFNPKKEVVLTDVYLDPAKQGWLLSAIVPIYNKNKLEGVTGIDISLNSFISEFLNMRLPYDGKSFVINNNGKIIAMSKEIEPILDIKELEEYKYKIDEKINFTISKPNKFSMLNYPNKNIVENFKKIIENKDYSEKINLKGETYLFFATKINKTSWYTISLINESEILKNIKELENYYSKLGFLIIIGIFIFYVIFFFFLHTKAKLFVSKINNPLLKIIDMTKNIAKNKDIKNLESCGIYEIDKLSSNFNSLVKELDSRTNKLILEETKRVYQEKLANTDSLTGAYNRRYLNEFSIEYLKINQREKTDLSLLMIDLDDFKIINDTYGHKVGDDVIKSLVDISKNLLRENDLIVRFGGDEFLILLPNTNIENAKAVALKLIDSIIIYNKDKIFLYTVSIGISQFNENDKSIEEMIKRADKSLYKAKEKGKNCIF